MPTKLQLFENMSGTGVRTSHAIELGALVMPLQGAWVDTPTRFTLQIEEGKHLLPEGQLWAWVNHSCSPNLRVDTQKMSFVAVRPIAPEEELTFNYLSTEWTMAEPFECKCQALDCIGWIAGFSLLMARHHDRVMPLASEMIAQKRTTHLTCDENEITTS